MKLLCPIGFVSTNKCAQTLPELLPIFLKNLWVLEVLKVSFWIFCPFPKDLLVNNDELMVF